MARILVVSLPFAGHVGPLSAVAGELVRRGHEVVAYTGAKYRQRFAGAAWLPWSRAADFDDADLAATFPRIGDGKGLRGARANGEYVLFGTAPGQVADILAEAERAPFDALVCDQTAFGAAVAAQKLDRPWATVAVTPLSLTSRDLPPLGAPWWPATGPVGRVRDAALRGVTYAAYRWMVDPKLTGIRRAAGLGPLPPGRLFDGLYSPHLVLAQGVPGLDYVRGDLPPQVRFVGRLTTPAPAREPDLPSWWPDLADDRPVVHVTQGTLDVDPADLLKPAIAALADEPLLVVCSTGGADPSVLGPLPANARAAAFVAHDLLLPATNVMVTNGGWGGVLAAVQAGVPLVVAGGSLDKPEVARRVAWSGAGLDLRTGRPVPGKIRHAVRELLARPGFRRQVTDLGTAITEAGGTRAATDLVEGLLS